MEKIMIRNLRDWKFFYRSPWGIFFSIILVIVFYRLYSIDTNSNNGKALCLIYIAALWISYLSFDHFKNKAYSKYCCSINFKNKVVEQMENFYLTHSSEQPNKKIYLIFLNDLFEDCAIFEHTYIQSKIQSLINAILIEDIDDSEYLYDLLDSLKEDIYDKIDNDIEINTEIISILLA